MDIQQLHNQAQSAQRNGNLAEAARLYHEILTTAPVPEVMVNYGNVLARLGNRKEALAQYDQALKHSPRLFEALFNRGNLYLEINRVQEALDDYERAVMIRADVPAVWNNRGTALRRLRRSDEALASYDRAVALAPGHVNALTNRALALFDLRRLDQALLASDLALAVQTDFAEALYIKGNILRDLGRGREARDCFDRILKIAPGHGHALNGLAQMTSWLCDWDGMAALMPRLKSDIEANRSLIQPFVMMGYTDDAALLRRCAENYVHRTAPVQPPLSDGKSTAMTASVWLICPPIFTPIPPPS